MPGSMPSRYRSHWRYPLAARRFHQHRPAAGSAIIKARGLSSAASAANAVVDTVRSLTTPTPEGDWYSVAVLSDGQYDVEPGIISSFPCPHRARWFVGSGQVGVHRRFQPRKDQRHRRRTERREALVADLLGCAGLRWEKLRSCRPTAGVGVQIYPTTLRRRRLWFGNRLTSPSL